LKDIIENDLEIENYAINRFDISLKGNPMIENNLFKTKILKPVRIGTINKGGQGERIYSDEGHAITLSAYGGGVASKTGAYLINNKIRKLTPLECERLQGLPDNYTAKFSNTTRYKMIGNGFTVQVIKYILSFVSKKTTKKKQLELFH